MTTFKRQLTLIAYYAFVCIDVAFWTAAPLADEPKKPAKPRSAANVKWREVKRIALAQNPVWAPDGTALAVSQLGSGRVTFWDTADWKARCTFEPKEPTPHVGFMQFSPDGKYLVVKLEQDDSRAIVTVVGAANGEEVATIKPRDGEEVRSSRFSPKGDVLAIVRETAAPNARTPKPVGLWDTGSWKAIETSEFDGETKLAGGHLSPDCTIFTTYSDKRFRRWDVKTAKVASQFESDGAYFDYSSDGSSLAIWHTMPKSNFFTVVGSFQIDLVDAVTGRLKKQLRSPNWSLAGNPQTDRLLDYTFRAWFSPSGTRLATGICASVTESTDKAPKARRGKGREINEVLIWNVDSGQVQARLKGQTMGSGSPPVVEYSPDERFICFFPRFVRQKGSLELAKGLKVFNTQTGSVVATLEEKLHIESAPYSPDGQMLAVNSWSNDPKAPALWVAVWALSED